jgi:hypothetical protein
VLLDRATADRETFRDPPVRASDPGKREDLCLACR